MNDQTLIQHADQINEAVATLVELEGMKAENKQRESLGQSMAYTEKEFQELLNRNGLDYNSRIEKTRRFY